MHFKKLIAALPLMLIVSFYACLDDKTVANEKPVGHDNSTVKIRGDRPNLNISFLLDLSDRIALDYDSSSMSNYQKDLGYIKSVTKAFEMHLRNKKSRAINDKIQVFLSPEPSDKNLNDKIESLKMEFNRGNATRENIISTSARYDSILNLIYKKAIKENKFPGSDIWRFFRNNVKDFCIKDNFRNILIILTDGYMYHKDTKLKEGNLTSYLTSFYINAAKINADNWRLNMEEQYFGFIPATENLENLEILVLGIDPKDNDIIEEQIISTYWSDWFNTMKVKRYDLKTAELPSNMNTIIQDFILNE